MALSKAGRLLSKAEILGVGVFSPLPKSGVSVHFSYFFCILVLGVSELSVPKNRNCRKIAAFSNRKVLNRRFCCRNRRKIARKSQKKSQTNR